MMTDKKIPFVGLHAHSVAGSIFDAIGFPDEHMDWAYSNGCEALALTDHGNMNGFSHQFLHWKKMKAEGKNFKPIFGVEAYFLPSIEEWRGEYERIKEDAKLAKSLAKSDTSGATVEDEEESKKAIKSILNRRRHLVLLAQNQTGLNNLFKLISESYNEENYYRYPRVDYKMLDKYSEGIKKIRTERVFTTVHGEGKRISYFWPFVIVVFGYSFRSRRRKAKQKDA